MLRITVAADAADLVFMAGSLDHAADRRGCSGWRCRSDPVARSGAAAYQLGKSQSSARLLIVKDTISLDARRRLHLIQHGERSVLLLTGGETDLVVGWLDGPKSP